MKNVIITGAGGAIGTAMAFTYAKKGYGLTLLYRTSQLKTERLAALLSRQYRIDAIAVPCDLCETVQVNRAVEQSLARFGQIDVLINNAGIAQQKLFTDLSDDEWARMLDTDLTAVFRTCRAVLPSMIHRKEGAILNISSMWGQVGASCEVSYSAAKAGVIGLSQALAKEVGPSGITVNVIAPGVIRSPMLASFTQEDLDALTDETPMGRLGVPEDVASMAVAVTENHFMTGQVIGVNGGFVIG